MNALHDLIFLHETDTVFAAQFPPGIHFCAKRIGTDPATIKLNLIKSSFRIVDDHSGEVIAIETSVLPSLLNSGINAVLTVGGLFPFVVGATYFNDRNAVAPIWDGDKWSNDFCTFLLDHGVNVNLVNQLTMEAGRADTCDAANRRHDLNLTPLAVLHRLRNRARADIANHDQRHAGPTGPAGNYGFKMDWPPVMRVSVTPKITEASPLHRAMRAKAHVAIGLVLPEQR